MRSIILIIVIFSTPFVMSAAEKVFPQTAVNTHELKTIPASKLIVSQSDGYYFGGNNSLFRPLFRYISQNDIAMTTPVEAEMRPGKMYFYIGRDAADRDLSSNAEVEVLELPERLVASLGSRGSYSEQNFNRAMESLENWLADHPTHKADGAARAIFWNGPDVPGFMKRFEVHIPVVEKAADDD
ncbi:MAG: heme-binding protein [Verrucomicrobiota bacterium]